MIGDITIIARVHHTHTHTHIHTGFCNLYRSLHEGCVYRPQDLYGNHSETRKVHRLLCRSPWKPFRSQDNAPLLSTQYTQWIDLVWVRFTRFLEYEAHNYGETWDQSLLKWVNLVVIVEFAVCSCKSERENKLHSIHVHKNRLQFHSMQTWEWASFHSCA